MDVDKMQENFNESGYNDAPAVYLSCNYFCDEVILRYDNIEGEIEYRFTDCYKVTCEHDFRDKKFKAIREMTFAQIPYSIYNVDVGMCKEGDLELYIFEINMTPLYLKIWCQNAEIIERP